MIGHDFVLYVMCFPSHVPVLLHPGRICKALVMNSKHSCNVNVMITL